MFRMSSMPIVVVYRLSPGGGGGGLNVSLGAAGI